MSADMSRDVSLINDEELLKKMWQDTDDFGRKKEIRSHMYKLREARLKEFYNSGEIESDIKRNTRSIHTSNSKFGNMTTHADNLADHSFLSLKSKEIRDSESPTRDVSYKISDQQLDHGWTVTSRNERSDDGKTHTSTHLATTAGTHDIQGGKIDYDAKAQHQSSVFQDGDDKNFTKAVADSSNSVIHQEAVGGDENSSFKTSTTKSSSSSRYVSESKSTSGDYKALPSSERLTSSTKVYTHDAPQDVKNHPSYIEGNTKVTQETQTLADGTIVTTTKYETRKGNAIHTTTNKKYSSSSKQASEQKLSSSHAHQVHSSSSTRSSSNDARHSTLTSNNQKAIDYVCEPGSNIDLNQLIRDHHDLSEHNTGSRVSRTEKSHSETRTNRVVNEDHHNQYLDNQERITNQKYIDTKVTSYEDVPTDRYVTKPQENIDISYSTTSNTTINDNRTAQDHKKQFISDQFITTQKQHEKDTGEVIVTLSKPSTTIAPSTDRKDTVITKHYVTESRADFEPTNVQPQSPRERRPSPSQPYQQPARRQPIRHEQEINEKLQPTEGQYNTTYRSDFTNKRISVDVNATHDAFARSLRAVTPERIVKNAPHKTSSPSLRSSTSPEKHRYPSRSGSPKKSDKFSSSETITYSTLDRRSPTKSPERDTYPKRKTENAPTTRSENYNTDTITKKKTSDRITRQRSPSPSGTITSDFEYIRNVSDIVTDLDVDVTSVATRKNITTNRETRPTSLEITTKKTKKVTERSPTSPLTDITRRSPQKEMIRKSTPKSPVKDVSSPKASNLPEDRPLKRTDTYEERVKQILGLTNITSERRRSSLERNSLKRNSFTRDSTKSPSSPKIISNKDQPAFERLSPERKKSPVKEKSDFNKNVKKSVKPSYDKTSPIKDKSQVSEFPSQTRRSPEKDLKSPLKSKESISTYPQKIKPTTDAPNISEFPSQIRKSPEKEQLPKYPEKIRPSQEPHQVSEFPSQIRKSHEKKTTSEDGFQDIYRYDEQNKQNFSIDEDELFNYQKRPNGDMTNTVQKTHTVDEFLLHERKSEEEDQLRKQQESRQLPGYPNKAKPTTEAPTICEFPSQIRRSPEKEPLPEYPEKTKLRTKPENVSEFPSKIKKTQAKEPIPEYTEKTKPSTKSPSVSEFPAQIRKSPEKEPLPEYPEKTKLYMKPENISEFPSQVKRTNAKEYLPEKTKPNRQAPSVSESPEKEPIPEYPEKSKLFTSPENVSEFPSQVKRTKAIEPLPEYPAKTKPNRQGPSVSEFPAQLRKSLEKEPLPEYPEKTKLFTKPENISEFPSQIKRTIPKEPLPEYPEKTKPNSQAPSISEFPSQVTRSPEKEPLSEYPQKTKLLKTPANISEFPSQAQRPKSKEPLPEYTEKTKPNTQATTISEFRSQVRMSPEKQPLPEYPEITKPSTNPENVLEFPSQPTRTKAKEPPAEYQENTKPKSKAPSISEFRAQIRKSSEKEPLPEYPEKTKLFKKPETVSEFPSHVEKPKAKEFLPEYPEKTKPSTKGPVISKFPSQSRKSPEKESLPESPKEKRSKPTEKSSDFTDINISQFNKMETSKTDVMRKTDSHISEVRKSLEKEFIAVSPTKPKQKTKKTNRPETTDRTSSSSEDELEEEITQTNIKEVESKVPVEEPVFTKKFIDQMCKDEELQRTAVSNTTTNKKVLNDINKTVVNENITTKKFTTDKTNKNIDAAFIKTEKDHIRSTTSKDTHKDTITKIGKQPSNRKLVETVVTTKTIKMGTPKTPIKPKVSKLPETTKLEKPKSTGVSEYTSEYSKTQTIKTDMTPRKTQRNVQKITLHNVENLDNLKEDNTVHIRTHRIDDTANRKITVNIQQSRGKLVNGDIKKKPRETSTPDKTIRKAPGRQDITTKPSDHKPKPSIQSRYTTTVKKNISVSDNKVSNKPQDIAPKKHIVTATINVAPKSKSPLRPKQKLLGTISSTETTKKLNTSKTEAIKLHNIQNGDNLSDTEHESDIEEEESVTEVHRKLTKTSKENDVKTSKTPRRDVLKPELDQRSQTRRMEKKCITTKTVIINNRDVDAREIIVDLQRSKSSREPTPDRLCPMPVTSDEESEAPRYPDQISEPDDGTFKRKPKSLKNTPIMENEDVEEFTAIREVEDLNKKITAVDKVEITDESLLSINKKINRFLDTADQLTKEPIKPKAPKVERPKLIVTDDLISDECLLSVSDKVSKFINTAEQLVNQKALPERPKSPKCKNYQETQVNIDITENVSNFVSPRESSVILERPDLSQVDENMRNDESLLSVSDKVNKFINAAEKLTNNSKNVSLSKIDITPATLKKSSPQPQSKYVPPKQTGECVQIETEEHMFTRKSPERDSRKSPERTTRPTSTDHRRSKTSPVKSFIDSEIRQISSESTSNRSYSPERDRRVSPNRRSPEKDISKLSPIKIPSTNKPQASDFDKTPDRRPSNEYSSVSKSKTNETQIFQRDSSPTIADTTPKSTRKSAPEDQKGVSSTASRLRSTDSIKKARALFENINKDRDIQRQNDILSRPSVFEGRRLKSNDTRQEYSTENFKTPKVVTDKISRKSPERISAPIRPQSPKRFERFRSTSPEKIPESHTLTTKVNEVSSDDVPHYMKPLDRSIRTHSPHRDETLSSEPSEKPDTGSIDNISDADIPHYMKPLDRSMRQHSPHRENNEPVKNISQDQEDDLIRPTKFGVNLRRTDSGKAVTSTITSSSTTTEQRKSSITLEKRVTEEEIEEIFELELLEELLEKVVGYDLRRKIRTQIRLVKKLISENSLEIYVAERRAEPREAITRRGSSPAKTKPTETVTKLSETVRIDREKSQSPQRHLLKDSQHRDIISKTSTVKSTSEYKSLSTQRKNSSEFVEITSRKSVSPTRERIQEKQIRTSPERKVTKTTRESTPTRRTTVTKTTEVLPNGLKSTTTKTTESRSFTTLKKTSPIGPKKVVDDQPEWVRKTNLRKVGEAGVPTDNKKVSNKTSTNTITKTTVTNVRGSSPVKDRKPTDIITSSYGVGPTDENGSPLFGLKALRAQKLNEQTTKVHGTVITSEFYSENGKEPVGQVKVTKYSTDPKDLDLDGSIEKNQGMTSVTTTQQFGYKDTPSLQSLTDTQKTMKSTETNELTTKTTKLNRRGSVKALSQKFIDNATESLKNERQTTYPKAGLILRTSSFKDSGSGSDDSGDISPADRDCEASVTIRQSTRTSEGESFLSNKSRISGVQDVITRMKAEDYEVGDSDEDIAARGLLNKFLGAQVILSGIESHTSSQTETISSSPTTNLKRTTKVITTKTESGKPTTCTRIFQRPVSEQDLETVWEEQTLRLLLEQSTDYEERRIIRARLRLVMAEQEACTELVARASEEEKEHQSTGKIEEKVERTKEVSSKGATTTTKVTTLMSQQSTRPKPLSPFAKFRQLDKQNSLNQPSSPRTFN